MISLAGRLLKPLLFALDPETAHGLSVRALQFMPPMSTGPGDSRLRGTLCGLDFPNPLGLAAGYDKGAEVPDALLRLGFGFVEVGTITPLPQPGNPRPRLFRLPQDEGTARRMRGLSRAGTAPASSASMSARTRSRATARRISRAALPPSPMLPAISP